MIEMDMNEDYGWLQPAAAIYNKDLLRSWETLDSSSLCADLLGLAARGNPSPLASEQKVIKLITPDDSAMDLDTHNFMRH